MSHGESLPGRAADRFDSPGFYCLDEPEGGRRSPDAGRSEPGPSPCSAVQAACRRPLAVLADAPVRDLEVQRGGDAESTVCQPTGPARRSPAGPGLPGHAGRGVQT